VAKQQHGDLKMSTKLSVTEVVRHFSEYINRISYRGEHFLLLRGKKVVAELRPAPAGKRLGELPDLLRSLPHLSETEADAFAEDLSKARSAISKEKLRDPWES
jgi:antitoxin (DNA-binding transcriptional repressor) of toxin-antitoxin stability system